MNAWTVVYLSVLFILENGALEKWRYSWVGYRYLLLLERENG